LHPNFGNLHVPDEDHPALVSDLVEEFRAPIVDSTIVALIAAEILTPEDFIPPDEKGGVYLHQNALKTFLQHWEAKLQSVAVNSTARYEVSYRRCLELQVREYAACVIGDIIAYRPFLLK